MGAEYVRVVDEHARIRDIQGRAGRHQVIIINGQRIYYYIIHRHQVAGRVSPHVQADRTIQIRRGFLVSHVDHQHSIEINCDSVPEEAKFDSVEIGADGRQLHFRHWAAHTLVAESRVVLKFDQAKNVRTRSEEHTSELQS